MRVLVFGATGRIGRCIVAELLAHGHEVTGVSRKAAGGPSTLGLTMKTGDVTDPGTVIKLAAGHHAVASAVGPTLGVDNDEQILLGATQSLITALRKTDVRRLVVVGGAGSLEVAPGQRLVDSPHFPAMWKANALAQGAALELYREVDDLDWTYVSPAAMIELGERTGDYRVGGDQLMVDADGHNRISTEDYAAAFVDELENGSAIRRRISVAY
ncbi:MAG: NAD(P)-dependent oxidoreductase [Pseudonocardiales bacterium]|nr:NAD(P)-dependent oxidoreductase [Pseudonocardiales bacterium]MBV9030594.1 NAD(P)-dependent oxidoreductase [Pseudonocardiales bacterium]